jgi:hypothetical protein
LVCKCFHNDAAVGTLVVVLLRPLSSSMYGGELDLGGDGVGGGGSAAAAAAAATVAGVAAVAVAAVDDNWWQKRLATRASTVA